MDKVNHEKVDYCRYPNLININNAHHDYCFNSKILSVSEECIPDTLNISLFRGSGSPTNTMSCDQRSSTTQDAWFVIELPDNRDYILKSVSLDGKVAIPIIEVYEGDCNSLSLVECNKNSSDLFNAIIYLKNFHVGKRLYVRVGAISLFTPFGICITPEIENDKCENSESLMVDGICKLVTNVSSSPSCEPIENVSCGSRSDAFRDVWFNLIVPPSGNLLIETNEVEYGLSRTTMEVYSGDCNLLQPIACSYRKDSFGSPSRHSRISLGGQEPGMVLFVRVGANYNKIGAFEICVSDTTHVDPCKIDLIELESQSLCDSITNTYSQELRIHYRHDGNIENQIYLNDSEYAITGSPQLIVIDDLPSNGNEFSISANIGRPNNPLCRVNSEYFSSSFYKSPDVCFEGDVLNDECINAIPLKVSKTCNEELFDMTGATSNDYVDRFCFYAGEYPQDVWFSFIVPNSGEAVVSSYSFEIDVTFEVYSGACAGLTLEEECGDEVNSLRVKSTPGKKLYVRVADKNADQQGEFGICIIEVERYSNDICINAIDLPVMSGCVGAVYSDHFASAGTTPNESLICSLGERANDLWFKIVVPSNGSVTLLVDQITSGFSGIALEIYEGSCNNLSIVDCNLYGLSNGQDYIHISERQVGEILYIREDSRLDRATFKICALTECPEVSYLDFDISNNVSITASNKIITTSKITQRGYLKLNATNCIEINSDFEVDVASVLEVFMKGCGN